MADFIVFRKTGDREDGTPELSGPVGPIVRGLKADEYEKAIEQSATATIGDSFVALRWDTSAEVVAEGPPKLKRVRG